jgi:hypothetical protein
MPVRRGLIAWSKTELPEATLNARIARAQAAMREAGLDALLLYTNNTRPAAVTWLSAFVPYFSDGLLLVPREGKSVLVVSMSKRVINWVIATSYVGEVASGPRIGIEAGKRAAALGKRVGVAELDELPAGIAADLVALGLSLVDATGLMEKLRGRADPAEVALAGKAAAIAEHALVRAAKPHPDGADAVAAVEAAARLLGAEEIFITLAADLGREKTFRRITGRPALGARYALRATLAYKGIWVRSARSFGANPATLARATESFAAAVAGLPDGAAFQGMASWLVEGCRIAQPLAPLMGSRVSEPHPPAPGSLVSVQASLVLDGESILIGAPALIGAVGEAAGFLVAPAAPL